MSKQCQELKGKLNQGVLKMYPNLQEKEAIPSKERQEILPDNNIYGLSKVIVEGIPTREVNLKATEENQTIIAEDVFINKINLEKINLQEKEVQPTNVDQVITADLEFDGLKQVTVGRIAVDTEKVTVKSKKENQTIKPTIGKLFDEVEVEKINLQEKEIEPQIYEQIVGTDNLYDGISKIKIGAVSHEIDSNIIPTNIRKGKTILGVEGNLEEDKPDQEKTVLPSKEIQVVVADTGYELAKVTVNGVQTENITVKSSKEQQTITPSIDDGFIEIVTVEPMVLENINVSPTIVKQEITTEYDGIEKVIVNAVDSNIDENIKPENIKEGTTILGIEGTVKELNGEKIEINASTETQTITPHIGYNAITEITVNPVENVTAENIKVGETILNVTGTFTADGNATAEDIAKNKVAYVNGERIVGVSEGGGSGYKLPDGVKFYTYAGTSLPSNIDSSEMTDMNNMFYNSDNLVEIDLTSWDLNNVIDINHMFYLCRGLEKVNMGNSNFDKVKRAEYMCYSCIALNEINNLNFKNLENISYMFQNCSQLVNIDLSEMETNNVTNMSYMFSGCTKLESINCGHFNISRINNPLQNTFLNCTALTNESLHNIVKMLSTATRLTRNKTLKYMGLTQEQATICTTFSEWADCVAINWTTGY